MNISDPPLPGQGSKQSWDHARMLEREFGSQYAQLTISLRMHDREPEKWSYVLYDQISDRNAGELSSQIAKRALEILKQGMREGE